MTEKSKRTPKGDIRVATIYSIGMYELAPILKKFMRAYPKVHVHLQYRRSDIIYDLVLKNKIDVGLVAYPENRSRINVTPFGNDHLVLILPPHHPLAKQRNVRLNRIRGERFIAFNRGIPTRKAVEIDLGISIVPSKTIVEKSEEEL